MACTNFTAHLPHKKARMAFLAQAAFGTACTYLTSGVFLSGLALLMGAGDVLVSYLSVIVNLCGVLILGASSFLERFQSRKKLTITLTALARLATLFLVFIPAIAPPGRQLALFVPAVAAAFTLQAQANVTLNQWMTGFVDGKKSGRYISLRQTLTLLVTVVLASAGGRWMDRMAGQYAGFLVLFAAAALLGLGEIAVLARTPDGALSPPAPRGRARRNVWKLPFQNRRFTAFAVRIAVFYLLLNISDSFTAVYMMKYLALPYQTITALSMLLSLPQIALLSIFGKLSDQCGHAFVLDVSLWLFAGETLFLFFASPARWRVFLPLAFLVGAAANAGFAVAVFNRRYELMPQENRIGYDNFYTALIGLGVLLGPLLGGALKGRLAADAGLARALPFAGIRLLYLVSTAGILLLQLGCRLPFLLQKMRRRPTSCT